MTSASRRKRSAPPAAPSVAIAPPNRRCEMRRWMLWHVPQIIGATAVCALLIFVFDPRPPVEIDKVEIDPQRVEAGSDINIMVTMRVRRQCDGHLVRQLVSDEPGHPTQVYDTVPAVIPTVNGETQTLDRAVHIPHGFSRGSATYRARFIFHCNPINEWWPIVVPIPDAKVVVEGAADKGK
jgi:hypothetical protein